MMATMSRRLRALGLGTGVLALVDQGIVSLGTFLTSVVLARTLAPTDYGVFVLVFGLFLVLSTFHMSLITYPLSVRAAGADADVLRRLTGYSVALTLPLALSFGILVGAVAWVTGGPHVVPWAVWAVVAVLLQETVRRALIAHLRYQDVLWGDAVSFLGQAALVWLLAQSSRLSIEATFAAMALTSMAATVMQMLQVGVSTVRLGELLRIAREYWSLGRWVLLTHVANTFTYQAFPWTVALFHGRAEAAGLQAAANLVGISNPVVVGVNNLIVPAAARARSTGGERGAWQAAVRYGMQGGVVVLTLYAGLMLWPSQALSVLYGADSSYVDVATGLRLWALAYVFFYLTLVLERFLNAIEQNRPAFMVQLVSSIVAVVVGLPLAAAFSVTGACAGLLLANVARLLVSSGIVLPRVRRP